jgi:hypothetical protein
MIKRPLVVLLGDSVLIDGVAVSLEGCQELGVARLDTPVIDIEACIQTLKPDVVVFELDSLYSLHILSLLTEQPGIQLVGLDLTSSRVLVLNSRQHTTRSMDEFSHVIHTLAGQGALLQKGGHRTELTIKLGVLD